MVKEGESLMFLTDNLGAMVIGATETIANETIDENVGEENE
jgi:hypothetical protein